MTSSANAEPKGSEPSSTDCHSGRDGQHCSEHDPCCYCNKRRAKPVLVCTCGCPRGQHENRKGACYSCTCAGFRCDHSTCGWKPREEEPEQKRAMCGYCDAGLPQACTCPPEPRCERCGHHVDDHGTSDRHCVWALCACQRLSGGPFGFELKEPAEEPPMTPEEEEMVPGYEELARQRAEEEEQAPPDCKFEEGCHRVVPCDPGCGAEPPPPQPGRRPPYLLAYSVQGHLYEVALPGDATVRAVDGALVITHSLAAVAGIVQIMPLAKEGG